MEIVHRLTHPASDTLEEINGRRTAALYERTRSRWHPTGAGCPSGSRCNVAPSEEAEVGLFVFITCFSSGARRHHTSVGRRLRVIVQATLSHSDSPGAWTDRRRWTLAQ